VENDRENQDSHYDDVDEPVFQPLKKKTGKAPTLKSERQRHAREWGRALHKFQKQRRNNGKP
jgi:hypothetical protein